MQIVVIMYYLWNNDEHMCLFCTDAKTTFFDLWLVEYEAAKITYIEG
jgi:hypothetical protein